MNEQISSLNSEEMYRIKNRVEDKKIKLACESIKFSINLMIKIDASIERKIMEETHYNDLAEENVVYHNIKSCDISIEKLNDLLIKIKMFLNVLKMVSKYLNEEIECSTDTQQTYFSKLKLIVDSLISKLVTKSSVFIKNLTTHKLNEERKLCKNSDSLFPCHKYSDSTVNSENGEHSLII